MLSAKESLGPDGGYYVTHSWLVGNGLVPYRDFPIWHTPGIFYLQRVYSQVVGETRAGFAAEIWLQHIATLALFLFVARRYFAASVAACAFCAAVLLGSVSPLEGFYYVLEPHVNVFAWLSIALALVGAERMNRAGAASIWFWPLAAGLAAGAAFWIKQQGAVLLPLAAVIPSLFSGRISPRPAVWTAAGFAVFPLSFFVLHPDAWSHAIRFYLELARYATNRGPYAIADTWEGLRVWNWLIPLFPIGAASAGLLVRRGGTEDRRLGRVALGVLAAGFLLLVPSFLRPYRHYLLVPLPFALLAVLTLLRALALLPRRVAVVAGLAATVLAFGFVRPPLLALRRVLVPGFQEPTSWEREQKVAAFIARRAGRSPRIYVLPNVPQYYVYLQKRGDMSGYEFLPPDSDVRRALKSSVPVFIVDRGEADIQHYEDLLRSEGYRLTERFSTASAWLHTAQKDPAS